MKSHARFAGSDIGGPAGYTVTSPPPSTRDPTSPVPQTEFVHSVKPAADFTELNGDPQADHTVLLKVTASCSTYTFHSKCI